MRSKLALWTKHEIIAVQVEPVRSIDEYEYICHGTFANVANAVPIMYPFINSALEIYPNVVFEAVS